MSTKFLSFFRTSLMVVILFQFFATQANEVQMKPKEVNYFSIVADSIPAEITSLSQFKGMNNRELDVFFKQNARDLLPKFRLGRTFSYVGLGAMISGAVIASTGVVLLTCFPQYRWSSGSHYWPSGYVPTGEYVGGIILTSLGGAITVMGASFTIAGFDIKNQCKKSYINKHFNNSNISTLKVGCTNNGIGLSLNF